MKISDKKLPQSRRQYTVEMESVETNKFFSSALKNLAPTVKIQGFRPGKAPEAILRQHISADKLREEAYSLAVREAWQEVGNQIAAKGAKTDQSRAKSKENRPEIPISDPDVEVEVFEEGKDAKLVFEFDIRPEVKVKDWQKIKIPPAKDGKVTDKEVDEIIESLRRTQAKTVVTLERSKQGDQLEIDFEGSIGGIRKDKLSGKHFPLVLGRGSVIPGFEENLSGVKKGEQKVFTTDFPADHFDKDLAGQTVEFSVKINEVFNVILPVLSEEFAKKYDHKSLKDLRIAIEKDISERKTAERFNSQKAKWLAQFEKKVETDVPKSLVSAEIERSRENWLDFLRQRSLQPQDWLKRRGTTMEQLEKDWQAAAASSVKIGLGLAEVAREMNRKLENNDDFLKLLDELVEKAVKK